MIIRLMHGPEGIYELLCQNGTIMKIKEDDVVDCIFNLAESSDIAGVDGRWNDQSLDMAHYPGVEIAYLTSWRELCISNPSWVKSLYIKAKAKQNKYISVLEYATIRNKSAERVKVLCREGRIAGAYKNGKVWFVPIDAPYPTDGRRKEYNNLENQKNNK